MKSEHLSTLAATEAICLDTSSPEFRSLRSDYRQQLLEAQIAAEMLSHLYPQETISMFAINLIGVEERAPDIKIRKLDHNGNIMQEEIVEIVSFTDYSEAEGFIAFLGRTKLNPTLAYPEQTIILLNIEVSLKNPELAAHSVSKALQSSPNVHHKMLGLFRNCKRPFLAELYPNFEVFNNSLTH